MIFATTVSLSPGTVTELTAGIDISQRFVLVLRIPAGQQTTPARIGTSGVSMSEGFSLDSQTPECTLILENDRVYGTPASSGASVNVDVLAYTAGE